MNSLVTLFSAPLGNLSPGTSVSVLSFQRDIYVNALSSWSYSIHLITNMFLMFYFLLGSGTFSQDAFRLIQAVQNGTLNEIIRIHEDLCSVVFSTVSAYSVWFVLHWFTYGASVVLTVIYISEEVHSRTKYHTPTIEFVLLGLILVCFLYQFLFPCFCVARMTTNCTGKIFMELH